MYTNIEIAHVFSRRINLMKLFEEGRNAEG